MNEFIAEVFERKLLGTGPQVAILKEVPTHHPIVCDQHPIDTDVKLPLVYQKGILYVTLNDECFGARKVINISFRIITVSLLTATSRGVLFAISLNYILMR